MEDYVNSHLNWISKHKDYQPSHLTEPYYDVMKECYSILMNRTPDKVQRTAQIFIEQDVKKYLAIVELQRQVAVKYHQQGLQVYFITISFNHQEFNVEKFKRWINKFPKSKWISKMKGKFEIYRTNGEHPHFHCIIEPEGIVAKSKVVEKIFNASKSLVLSKNFIDVKICEPRHYQYLDGIKTLEKLELCKMDKEYRELHDISEFYNK